jgi:hypothetical protein
MPVYDVSVRVRDAYNRSSTKRYQLDTTDHATAVTEVASFCADLAAAMEAEILEHSVALRTAYSDSALAGANLDEGITLSVELTSGKKAVIKIPAPVKSPVNADGSVDITDALISDFIDNWLVGNFLVSDGETVASLLSGKLDR